MRSRSFLTRALSPLILLRSSPQNRCSTEYTVGNLLCVACCPKVLQQVHDILSVVRNNLSTVGTFTTLVVRDDGSQTGYQSLWQFTLTFQVCLNTRKVTCLIFRE